MKSTSYILDIAFRSIPLPEGYENNWIPTAGKESNWIQSAPGKGWNTILRLYGPLEPWFDKTWRPGEIELIR